MGIDAERLTRLGRRLADEEATLADRARDPQARERFVAAALVILGNARERTPSPRLRAVAALAAVAAIGAGVLFFLGRRPLDFVVGAGESARAGIAGAWIATPADQPMPVRFSDGTTFDVQPQSKARVTSVDADGGRITLENGAVRASVVPRRHARWLVDSGPFEVRVTGTRFEVSWNLAAEELCVALLEGSVVVSGPNLGEHFSVRAGQTLRVQPKASRVELRGDDSPAIAIAPPTADVAPAPGPAPSGEPPPPAQPAIANPPPTARPVTSGRAPRQSWRELEAAGKFKEALDAVDREGFGRLCEEGSAADLRDLGDAARLSGDLPRAVVALTTLRRRFPGDDQAAEAAFLLGVIAFGEPVAMGGTPKPPVAMGESARWFSAYLAERPRGRLAREAAGRLIEIHERAGDRAASRAAARRYLRDFPSGPHAEMAKAAAGE
jgi:transmembrane sensor